MSDLKTCSINNRRYLGNKYKLLSFIKNVVKENCHGIKTVADIFSGTGAVASAFSKEILITNDLMYSNYLANYAWFSAEKYDEELIKQIIMYYNSLKKRERNYMTENFANTYFDFNDCSIIGFIRDDIEKKHKKGEINNRERAILITSLLYAMDKIAKTCGHYDAYIKGASYDKHIEMILPLVPNDNNPENRCFNLDANELVHNIYADLVYIDPPYNSRQYCDAYHLLENVARWEKPDVIGTAKKMDRKGMKSKYCTKDAAIVFADLVANLNCKYILFSYNNMANKGNGRSNAKISDENIIEILKTRGEVIVFSENYKAFTTGKSDIKENAERLFLCIVKDGVKS